MPSDQEIRDTFAILLAWQEQTNLAVLQLVKKLETLNRQVASLTIRVHALEKSNGKKGGG